MTHQLKWARQENVRLCPLYEHTSLDGILAYVMGGHCAGIIGGYVATTSPIREQIRVLDLPAFERVRRIVALYPARAGEMVSEFVAYCRSFYGAGALALGRS